MTNFSFVNWGEKKEIRIHFTNIPLEAETQRKLGLERLSARSVHVTPFTHLFVASTSLKIT